MLEVVVPDTELFDEDIEEFVQIKGAKLLLEHSLISISKWEMKWHVPFLGDKEQTEEQVRDYIRCMTINSGVDPNVYNHIPADQIQKIEAYIKDPMTATWFSSKGGPNRPKGRGGRAVITNEVVYSWMIEYQIPFDPCEKWHFERLMTLIRVRQERSQEPKKMSKRELATRNAALNAQRRARLKTRG